MTRDPRQLRTADGCRSRPEPREIPFAGVRLRFDSSKNFDELVDALLSDVGEKPVMIDDIAINFENWDAYQGKVETYVGPRGFMLFGLLNHGGWIKKATLIGRRCGSSSVTL